MTNGLLDRIAELRGEIDRASDAERDMLLDHLDQAVAGLQTQGLEVPGWATARLAVRIDEQVEDQFDNMPV